MLTIQNKQAALQSKNSFLETVFTNKLNIKKLFFLKKKNQLKKKRKVYRKLIWKQKQVLNKKDEKKNYQEKLSNKTLGILHLLCNKRNVFCTLSNYKGRIKASVSCGMLKVKGKKRKAFMYVPITAQLLINYIFKLPYKDYFVITKGNGHKKKKRNLLKAFTKIRKFNFYKINNIALRSHNGCRAPKIRRK